MDITDYTDHDLLRGTRQAAINVMRVLADMMELIDHCEGSKDMNELLTSTDLMAEFKISRPKANEFIREHGLGSGKIRRITRRDALAHFINGDLSPKEQPRKFDMKPLQTLINDAPKKRKFELKSVEEFEDASK